MGNVSATGLWDSGPETDSAPTFDPIMGFPNGRKKRVMIATEEEMIAAQVPEEHRDYCAHMYLKLLECKKDHYPFMYSCAHQKHQHSECEYHDYVLRMKEFERERRLREKQKRKEATQ